MRTRPETVQVNGARRFAAGARGCAGLIFVACGSTQTEPRTELDGATDPGRAEERRAMVNSDIEAWGVKDPMVLEVLGRVPRHRFVPEDLAASAYEDRPLSIGYGQTISQPFIVGYMTEALKLDGDSRVLEIGTGSGYQAAVLAEIAAEVYSIEIVAPLAERAKETLAALGYEGIHLRTGDGYRGWPEAAPFDAIVITAAPEHVPAPLLEQLAPGGRMVVPVGGREQELLRFTRSETGIHEERLLPVRFVPMTGEALER
jgi:protein-L-isoaspartate(D-aspartate) O-methyltransferase